MDNEQTVREGINALVEMAGSEDETEGYIAFRGLKRVKSKLAERAQLINSEKTQAMLETLSEELAKTLEKIHATTGNELIKASGVD
jgi:hypothetical protein